MYLTLLIIVTLVSITHQNVITTAQGLIRGVSKEGYISYVGIPYASANGTGRFKRAGIAPSWQGIREANDPHCTATSPIDKCLQLDVNVPTIPSEQPWPILVWVKGGSGFYHPGQLVRRGIIMVTVRHRIGPLGFLCTDEEQIPGNAGVKDVVLALRWVRDNIVAFRGNPDNVVIAGESFGAAIVETIMLSPMSQGLFHGAIMQSGTVLSPWAFNYDPKSRVKTLLTAFKNEEFPKILLQTSVEELVEKSNNLAMPYFPFGICVERSFKKEERVIAEPPYDLISEGQVIGVPLIIGYNNNEGYIFATMLKITNVLRRLSTDMMFLLPMELEDMGVRELNQTRDKIKDIYFKNGNFSLASVIEFHSDAYFINHIHRSARLHSSSAHYPVYYYRFSHSGNTGVEPENDMDKVGAAHSDELAFLFSENGRTLSGDDGKVQDRLVTLWTNFVRHLIPTPDINSIAHWEPMDYREPRLLNIGMEMEMIDYSRTAAMSMWDEVYEKYYTRKRPE